MNSFINTIKTSFKSGSTLMQLIYINVAVFIVLKLSTIILMLFKIETQNIFQFLEVPANLHSLLLKPWTVLTYMFVHLDFFHIFFNMLCLYWFGRIFLEFLNPKQLVAVYILGGIGGALTYIGAYNFFPLFTDVVHFSHLIGASAAVMGIMTAAAVIAPNYPIRLLLIGEIKLKIFAIVMIAISIFGSVSSNAGGEFAHIGGAILGYLYAVRLRKGKDLAKPITAIINYFTNLFKAKPKIKVHKYNTAQKVKTDAEYNQERKKNNDDINRILDKIKQSGYDSLTEKEKKQLFDLSQK